MSSLAGMELQVAPTATVLAAFRTVAAVRTAVRTAVCARIAVTFVVVVQVM